MARYFVYYNDTYPVGGEGIEDFATMEAAVAFVHERIASAGVGYRLDCYKIIHGEEVELTEEMFKARGERTSASSS